MAVSNREKQLIQFFLKTYNEYHGSLFRVVAWPDETDRSGKAIDAIAEDGTASHLGIEHTLLQPFSGERQDSHIFMQTVGQIDKKASLLAPGFDVNLCFLVGAVPKGVDWSAVAPAVEAWYDSERFGLCAGRSQHHVPGLGFDLVVDVEKVSSSGPGHLFVERWMPNESVEGVVRQALTSKLPKLAAAPVARCVLLLEKGSPPRGYGEIGQAIEDLRPEFALLNDLDEAWVINTVALESEAYSPSYLVWPHDAAVGFSEYRHRA